MINGKHYVTVASDASPGATRTGYAYYIRDDAGTTKHAWYENKVSTSTNAEVEAMIKTLEEVDRRAYPPNTVLIYYCDNEFVLNILLDRFSKVRTKARNKWRWHIYKAKLVTDKFESIDARHVPAHTGKDDLKRYYLNKWCDFNARAMQRHKRLHRVKEWQ